MPEQNIEHQLREYKIILSPDKVYSPKQIEFYEKLLKSLRSNTYDFMTAFWLAHCDSRDHAYSLYVERFPNEKYIRIHPNFFQSEVFDGKKNVDCLCNSCCVSRVDVPYFKSSFVNQQLQNDTRIDINR